MSDALASADGDAALVARDNGHVGSAAGAIVADVLVAASEPLVELGLECACRQAGLAVALSGPTPAGLLGCCPHAATGQVVVACVNRVDARLVAALVARGAGVLIVARQVDRETVMSLVHAGARGFVHTSSAVDEFIAAIRAVAAGQFALAREAQAAMFAGDAPVVLPSLSVRERQILLLMADGRTGREIAGELFLVEATVKTHVQRIGQKLGERRRAGMIARAARYGLI